MNVKKTSATYLYEQPHTQSNDQRSFASRDGDAPSQDDQDTLVDADQSAPATTSAVNVTPPSPRASHYKFGAGADNVAAVAPAVPDGIARDSEILRRALTTYPQLALEETVHFQTSESPVVLENDRTKKPADYDVELHGERYWADSPIFLDENDPVQCERWRLYDQLGGLQLDATGRPKNPAGGSTVAGRGQLGYWGPNPASDNLLFRWQPDSPDVLQLALIQRRSGAWALPGGMQDDEPFHRTAVREAQEEMGLPDSFTYRSDAAIPYAGFVIDRRNTSNAWMITAAYAVHPSDDQYRDLLRDFTPRSTLSRSAGADRETLDAQWFDVDLAQGFLNGRDKDGASVKLDLRACEIPDTYGEDSPEQQRAWVRGLKKPREGSQAMFAAHGRIVLAAKDFVENPHPR